MTVKVPVIAASIVNARWNASSWSASSCWTYLSGTPTSLNQNSPATATDSTPQTP